MARCAKCKKHMPPSLTPNGPLVCESCKTKAYNDLVRGPMVVGAHSENGSIVGFDVDATGGLTGRKVGVPIKRVDW